MRQGPNYGQWVDRNEKGEVALRLPLELEQEWEEYQTVTWKDNKDGTYTLIPSKDGP